MSDRHERDVEEGASLLLIEEWERDGPEEDGPYVCPICGALIAVWDSETNLRRHARFHVALTLALLSD